MNRMTFKTLVAKLEIKLRNRLPMIHQTESAECGLACGNDLRTLWQECGPDSAQATV